MISLYAYNYPGEGRQRVISHVRERSHLMV